MWTGYAATLDPEPAVASVTTGVQSVVYSGAAGGGDFGRAVARANWHRDQRGAQSVPVELAQRVPALARSPARPGRDRGAAVGAARVAGGDHHPAAAPARGRRRSRPPPAIDRAVAPHPGDRGRPPPAPSVIRLAAPPQGPWRLPFPHGHPLRDPLLYQQATAAPRVGADPAEGGLHRPGCTGTRPCAGPPGQLGPRYAARVGRDQGAHPRTRRVPLPVLRRPGHRSPPRARPGRAGRRLAGVVVLARVTRPSPARRPQQAAGCNGARARPRRRDTACRREPGMTARAARRQPDTPAGGLTRGRGRDPLAGAVVAALLAPRIRGQVRPKNLELLTRGCVLAVTCAGIIVPWQGLGPACVRRAGPLRCRVTDNGAVICPGCGAAVPQRRGRGRPRRWCSDRCRSAESSRRARLRGGAGREGAGRTWMVPCPSLPPRPPSASGWPARTGAARPRPCCG